MRTEVVQLDRLELATDALACAWQPGVGPSWLLVGWAWMLRGFAKLVSGGLMSRAFGCHGDILSELLKIGNALLRDDRIVLRGGVAKWGYSVLQCVHSLVKFPLAPWYGGSDLLDLVEAADGVVPAPVPKCSRRGSAGAYEFAKWRR